METLGVDIGGVIIDKMNDKTDTSFFSRNYLQTTATPHSFRVLAKLSVGRFGKNIHLVSKAGEDTQARTREWLAYHKFFEKTGIPESNLHFCLERHEKRPICEQLKVTHFIDDRMKVLSHLINLVPNLYLFNASTVEITQFKSILRKVKRVDNWLECERRLQD